MSRRMIHSAVWMAAFEREVLKQMPEAAGRIEWPTAQHYFYSGVAAIIAAERYVENRRTITI